MSTELEDQERHLLIKVVNRILFKLDSLVRPYVHKIIVTVGPMLIDEDYFARVEGSLITVRNEKDKNKRHYKSNSAKTYAGNRDVLLPPAAVKIAKEHCKDKKSNDYIFVNEWKTSDGLFIDTKLNAVLKSISKRQNISKTLTVHIFRHTHVSILAEMGVPLYVIQRRVGHGDSRITSRIYLHVTQKAKKDLAEILNDFPNEKPKNDILNLKQL